jgi:hypothetical protein
MYPTDFLKRQTAPKPKAAPKPVPKAPVAAPKAPAATPKKAATMPPKTVAAVAAVKAQAAQTTAATKPTVQAAVVPAPSPSPVMPSPMTPAPMMPAPGPSAQAAPPTPTSQGEAVYPPSFVAAVNAAAKSYAKATTPAARPILQIGTDWSCDSSNVCAAKSPRAADAYVELQAAINRHLLALGMPLIPVSASIDQQTRTAVARFLPDIGSLPHSNLPITPWLFAAKIEALPKTRASLLPQQPLSNLGGSGLWWKVGLGVVGVVGAGYFAFKKRN